MSRGRYLVKKTVFTLILIFIVLTALFFLVRAMPGSIVDIYVQAGATPQQAEIIAERWGLNDPLSVQYIRYLSNLLSGNAGESFRYSQPVLELVGVRIFYSFILVVPAILSAYLLGSLYGAVMGMNRGEAVERYGVIPVMVVGTIPEFFLGILLILIFSMWLNLFPVSGILSQQHFDLIGVPTLRLFTLPDFWWHYTLPFLTILLRFLLPPSLLMRTSIVEVANEDFISFHRLKGLSRSRQRRHLMKHASLPVITLLPVALTRGIGGMVLVEVVFNWPGIGDLLVSSVVAQDYPVVQFVFFLVAVWVIVGNFFVDLLYGVIDPRVSVEGSGE